VSRSKIETLVHARRLAGGVSRLAEAIDVDAYVLDEMLHGVLERAQEFIKAAEANE
jgi:hypothetical protein